MTLLSTMPSPWPPKAALGPGSAAAVGGQGDGIGPGLTFHGLRHTVATVLRELGYDTETIADALGQSSPGMAMHYAKEADLRKKLTQVVKRFDRRMNKAVTKAVKPTD